MSHPGQLCLTSGIYEEIYRDVRAYLTGQGPESRGLTGWGPTCRDGNFVSVQPEDGYTPCQCPGCQAAYRMDEPAYATDLMWGFTKEIAERLTREGIDAVVVDDGEHGAAQGGPCVAAVVRLASLAATALSLLKTGEAALHGTTEGLDD